MKKYLLFIITIHLSGIALSQSPQQNCIGATPVCQNTYIVPNSFVGIGTGSNEINPSNSCLPNGEQNSVWYIFTVQVSGDLSFIIQPNTVTDDYNWSLYNLTNATCSDIYNNPALEVACNNSTDILGAFNTVAGRTGAYSDPPYYGDLGFVSPSFTGDIPTTAGETFALHISNFTGSPNGYTLDFSHSTAVLFNALTPEVLFVSPVTCGDSEVQINLNKPVLCSSVQASDFNINGYTITGISSPDCNTSSVFGSHFTISITPPISSTGSFQLYIQDTINDQCGNFNANDTTSFNVAAIVANAGTDRIFCKGDNVNFVVGDSTINYTNTTLNWSANKLWAVNALSNTNTPNPIFSFNNVPSDTIELYFNVSSGTCSDVDTIVLYFRDCCINYDAQISNIQDVSCFGASTGTAEATAIGSISGQNPLSFSYQWSNQQNSFLASGLSANTSYKVTVTDPLGCIDTASVILSEPATPVSTSATGSTLACFGDNTGTIDLTVNGGTAPYTFNWSAGAGTAEDPTGLTAGSYTVTVVDANNCTITQNATVSQPPTPLIVTGTANTIACGATNGTIDLSVNGGGSPYQYQWDIGVTSQDLNNVGPGTYTVTVTDVYGCIKIESYTINVIGGLAVTGTGSNIPCSTSGSGSASVSVSGGLPPYSYLWSNNSTTSSISNISVGTYTVTVTDATNCSVVTSASVNIVSTLSANANINDVSCFGGNDGSIQVSPSSSSGSTFTYLWSTNQTSSSLSNLTAGNYTLSITDANGCLLIETYTVNEPQAININLSANDISCFGGSDGTITNLVTGGTLPYSFIWSNNVTTQNITGLSVGSYSVTVTDMKNCTATQNINITQPSPINAAFSTTPVLCNGTATGAIYTLPSGGTAPYSYQWSGNLPSVQNPTNVPAGTYTLTITDANNCNYNSSVTVNQLSAINVVATPSPASCNGSGDGSIQLVVSGGNSPYTFQWSSSVMGNIQNPTGLSAGNYTVTVTDANNCTATTTTVVTQPSTITANATGSTIVCGGSPTGNISLTVSGGTSPYSFNWNNGGGNIQNPTNLFAGTYTVTITDANNCINVVSAVINELPAMQPTITGNTLNCFGDNNGTLSVAVVGGTPPYSYQWSNNQTTSSISNLTAGTYTVIITDANNCILTTNGVVTQPSDISIQPTVNMVSCDGNTDGSITLNVNGGISPYTYNWDNGLGTTPNPTNLGTGVYNVTVTDGNNCSKVATIPMTAPTPMTINTIENPATCNQNNGIIAAFATGGTLPYIYTWSPNTGVIGNTNTATNLGADTYSVTITDMNGCTVKKENIVFAPAISFNATAIVTDPQCVPNNGEIFITLQSNNVPFTYNWSSNTSVGNTNFASGLTAGNYSVTITDGDACDTIMNFILQNPTLLSVTETVQSVTCGQNNGQISLTINSGTPPYNYNWSPNANTGNIPITQNLAVGNYFVTVTDDNSCTQVLSIPVNGTDSLETTVTVVQPNCNQGGRIEIVTTAGITPYNYTWSPNANTGNNSIASNLLSGTYTVTITDNTNCSKTLTFELIKEGDFSIIVDEVQDNTCNNGQDGSINISTTSSSPDLIYQWSNQINTEDLNNLAAGNYSVTITDPSTGCTAFESFIIDEPEEILLDLGADITITVGEEVVLNPNLNEPDLQYSWLSDGSFLSNGSSLTLSPLQSTTVLLSVNTGNCPPITDQIVITVVDQGIFIVPEAFSPNQDGKNDIFRVFVEPGVEIVEMKLFNRWGETVHVGNNWDGTFRGLPMPNGSYPYLVVLQRLDGTEERKVGEVILVR